jgi:hypothetical protein
MSPVCALSRTAVLAGAAALAGADGGMGRMTATARRDSAATGFRKRGTVNTPDLPGPGVRAQIQHHRPGRHAEGAKKKMGNGNPGGLSRASKAPVRHGQRCEICAGI